MTSRMCQMEFCKRDAATLCFHCTNEVCKKHFIEHANLIMVEVHSLADQVNILADETSAKSISNITKLPLEDLERWKNESHKMIDEFYTEKQQDIQKIYLQIERKFTDQKIEQEQLIKTLREKIADLVEEGEATLDQIKRLQNLMEDIKRMSTKFDTNIIVVKTKKNWLDKNSCIIQHNLSMVTTADSCEQLLTDNSNNWDATCFDLSNGISYPLMLEKEEEKDVTFAVFEADPQMQSNRTIERLCEPWCCNPASENEIFSSPQQQHAQNGLQQEQQFYQQNNLYPANDLYGLCSNNVNSLSQQSQQWPSSQKSNDRSITQKFKDMLQEEQQKRNNDNKHNENRNPIRSLKSIGLSKPKYK
ncbi:unnamed protein product [Didymodactylos carnosus]|uniref:Uncharacterized protein n=1 Tax=Didymodactylos carnosus TaxID=1234261 RepID=A0A814T3A7_9BILA|nr:unnamed protein product [Didymodactylos carnosus]CAF1156454.1 unnamed protein product [Didymodactylos carnosus]CAF3766882.1 unnamed protein product [Didymodactylos carnosus]CAF3919892.1 unnamed protein product [Didymodactylos carnosus]